MEKECEKNCPAREYSFFCETEEKEKGKAKDTPRCCPAREYSLSEMNGQIEKTVPQGKTVFSRRKTKDEKMEKAKDKPNRPEREARKGNRLKQRRDQKIRSG
jgi:hypothetical protein